MTTENNQPPFSEASMDFTSDNAKVILSDSDSWAFRYDDFTIESWVNCSDLSETGDYLNDKTIFGTMTPGVNKQQFLFYIRYNGELGFWNGNFSVGGGKLENNTWHHVALVRKNLRMYMYLDGQLVYTGCNSVDYRQTNGFSIGAVNDPYLNGGSAWSRYFKGHMQDFRITNGQAVYTSNFVLAKSLLNKCSKDDRCPEDCILYVKHTYRTRFNSSSVTNSYLIQDGIPVSYSNGTAFDNYAQHTNYSDGKFTVTLLTTKDSNGYAYNVSISTSPNGPWQSNVLVPNSRVLHSRIGAYYPITYELILPPIVGDCDLTELTPTPIAQSTPTPTPADDSDGGNSGGGSDDENDGGSSGNGIPIPSVGSTGDHCTSNTKPTWTFEYNTDYPTPIEYEVKIGSTGNVVTITEQTYTSPEELPHGNHTFYVRGKSSQNRWSTWSDFTTEVRTHMPNVPVLYHTKSHARYGSTQAINSWPTWTVWGWYQVTDADGYGIKVNDEDEHLIGPGSSNLDGQMWYQRDKDSLGIGTHTVKVRARDCAGHWSDYSNEVTFTITAAAEDSQPDDCILPRDSRNWELIGEIQGSNVYSELSLHNAINYDGTVVATTEKIIDTAPIGDGREIEILKVFKHEESEWVQMGSDIMYPVNPVTLPTPTPTPTQPMHDEIEVTYKAWTGMRTTVAERETTKAGYPVNGWNSIPTVLSNDKIVETEPGKYSMTEWHQFTCVPTDDPGHTTTSSTSTHFDWIKIRDRAGTYHHNPTTSLTFRYRTNQSGGYPCAFYDPELDPPHEYPGLTSDSEVIFVDFKATFDINDYSDPPSEESEVDHDIFDVDNVQLSANGQIVAWGSEAANLYKPHYIDDTGAVAIYKFDGTNWNQLGQTIHGTVADEKHTEEWRLSADGTRLSCVPNIPRTKILTYEYSETENLWKVISTLDLHSLVDANSNIYKVAYSDDLKTIAFRYWNTTVSDYPTFIGVFEYNDEQSEWSLKGHPILLDSETNSLPLKFSKQATTLLTGNGYFEFDNDTWTFNDMSHLPYTNQMNGHQQNYWQNAINSEATRVILDEGNTQRWEGSSGYVNNGDAILSVYDRVGECWQQIGGYLNGVGHSETVGNTQPIVPTITTSYGSEVSGYTGNRAVISGNGKVVLFEQHDYGLQNFPQPIQRPHYHSDLTFGRRGRILIYSHPSESLPSEFPSIPQSTPTPTPIPESTPTPTETCNPTKLQFVMTSNFTNTLSNRNATTEDDDLTIDAVAYSLPIENIESGEGLHATEIPVTFSSSDENIVSVVDNGTKLSTTGVGTATITANVVGNCTYLSDVETQVQNGYPDYTGKTFTVTVSLAPTPTPTETCNPTEPQAIHSSSNSSTLFNWPDAVIGGEVLQGVEQHGIVANQTYNSWDPGCRSVGNNGPTGIQIIYSSSDENIVSVIDNGTKLSAVGAGTATITATAPGDCTYYPAEGEGGDRSGGQKTFTVTVSLAPTPSPQGLYGNLWAIGKNTNDAFRSDEQDTFISSNPYQVEKIGGSDIVQVCTTPGSYYVLKSNGDLYVMGDRPDQGWADYYFPDFDCQEDGSCRGTMYQIADNIEFIETSPSQPILFFKKISDPVLYAYGPSAGLKAQLGVGQLGTATTTLSGIRTVYDGDFEPLENIVQVSVGHNTTVFRTSDGAVYGAGDKIALGVLPNHHSHYNQVYRCARRLREANPLTKKIATTNGGGVSILQTDGKLFYSGHITDHAWSSFPDTSDSHQQGFYNILNDVSDVYETQKGCLVKKNDGLLYATGINSFPLSGEWDAFSQVQDSNGNPIEDVHMAQQCIIDSTSFPSDEQWDTHFTFLLKTDGTIYSMHKNTFEQINHPNKVNNLAVGFYSWMFTEGELN